MKEARRSEITCPKCGGRLSSVKDSRGKQNGTIQRRRECGHCGNRFTTIEIPIAVFNEMEKNIAGFNQFRDLLKTDEARARVNGKNGV